MRMLWLLYQNVCVLIHMWNISDTFMDQVCHTATDFIFDISKIKHDSRLTQPWVIVFGQHACIKPDRLVTPSCTHDSSLLLPKTHWYRCNNKLVSGLIFVRPWVCSLDMTHFQLWLTWEGVIKGTPPRAHVHMYILLLKVGKERYL